MRLGGGSGDLFLPCSEGPGVISVPSLVDFYVLVLYLDVDE